MILSGLFTSVADALISFAIDKLDPAERIKSWLKQDPARIAFQKALARAYSAFARQYPEYTSSLFDQSFLSKEALPELSKLLTHNQHPDPALLAQAWGQSIGADVAFIYAATKPASYFLERLDAELKAEEALRALFDSRALGMLPRIEAEIRKLTSELRRGLDTALKTASDYQKVTLQITGDVKDSNIIIGDNNIINKYYYSGDFVSLNEYYIPPDGVFQRVSVDEFVGRDWLTAKVDAFLNDPGHKSGAFLLVGDAGVGKTAFMAHLVKERRYLHLFAEQVPGQAMLQRALQSLGSQLVTRYQIDPYKDHDTLNVLAGFPDFLERLLRLAASRLTEGEKIVIVCDALDEAGVFPDHFVFGLPKELPDGVYLILSQRPVNTKLPNFEPLRFDLEAQGEDNLQDMEAYLSAVAKRPVVAVQIRAKDYSEDLFIQTLKEKSLGVWMYLHYVIKEIERGQRAPLDLESLPNGLVGYYADYWDNWRNGRKENDTTKWDSLYAPLLVTLAAIQEAVTIEKLIEWAGIEANLSEVIQLLNESWSSFIIKKEEKDNTVYTLYHQSLRDFIMGKVRDIMKLPPTYVSIINELSKKKVEAHRRIVNVFETECHGEWAKLVEQDYPRLYLTAHLNGAGEDEKLQILLTEGDEKIKWAEAREKKEETYAGYLNDLTYVWNYAEREQNYALAIRCTLIENSIHSLASNIPPNLLAELAKAGLWSHARCLSVIRQKSNSDSQVYSLELFAPELPPLLFSEALSLAHEIKSQAARVRALLAIALNVTDEFKIQVFEDALLVANEIKNKPDRINALITIVPHLNNELKTQILRETLIISHEITDSKYHIKALTALVPHLNDEQKTQVLEELLVAVHQVKDPQGYLTVLSNLAPYFNGELKTQVLKEALVVVRKIKDEFHRVIAFSKLLPHLNNDLKLQVLQDALVVVHEIKDLGYRCFALIELLPCIQIELKTKTIEEVLFVASEIKEEFVRVRVLTALGPHLKEALKKQVFQEALTASRGINKEWQRVNELTSLFLSELLPQHDDDLLMRAVAVVQEVQDESERVRLLSYLLAHFKEDSKTRMLQDLLATTTKINDKNGHMVSLLNLSFYFNSELKAQMMQEALSIARKIIDESDRADALLTVALCFSDEHKTKILHEALIIANEIKDDPARASVLLGLLPYLPNETKTEVLQKVLATAREIKVEITRIQILSDLLPYFTDEFKTQVLLEALATAHEIKDEGSHAQALSFIAPHLINESRLEVLQEAIADARMVKSELARIRVLSYLMPHLEDELKTQILQEAWATLQEIDDESVRAIAFYDLASDFSSELIKQALTVAYEIKNKSDRNNALVALVPYLNDEFKTQELQDVLTVAHEIENKSDRGLALFRLVPYFFNEEKVKILEAILYLYSDSLLIEEILNIWKEIEFKGLEKHISPFIKFVSQENRKDSLEIITALTPVLIHFSGPEIVPELYRAITDVTRWWP